MSVVTRSSFLAVAAALSVQVVLGQDIGQPGFTALYDKHIPYNQIPYQVDPDPNATRGPQAGYNICNSTTATQTSECQTMIFNAIDDFCLWSSPQPDQPISDTEAVEVAWCTSNKYGARTIPQGTLTGVQFLTTPDYIEMIAFINQTLINLPADDFGGELDPHGADLRGNPMGGLVYSTHFTNDSSLGQVSDWNEFIGGGQMCIKLCNPSSPNRANLCENRYDLIGLSFNCPNQAQDNVFETCDSDNQDPVGTYTTNGQVMTWSQPAVGPITTLPYSVRIPSSSNCQTLQSTDLYTSLLAVASPSASGSSGASATPTASGGAKTSGGSSGAASRTSSGGAAPTGASQGNAASVNGVSAFATVFGVLAAVAFLA
ncbi:hypothetical protein EUX98_g4713 [Antrodiella citrinella]|uniref:Macrofage activating glycoprotein n=1 Tax=Antrodiella citrinella TaxID=2447956 RepID=A0A4S4MTB4_9APHY|nr:hypothetical protein EUX98_g4713 [Antrodiella citrinella]